MNQNQSLQRNQRIVRTSIIGIITNILLAAFKASVGILSHSIAITLDAVNNLSDALSSVITIIGTRLAGKKPDRDHPYGYGRIEYLSTTIIALIVLYAGISSLIEAVKSIITPESPNYSTPAILIVSVSVLVKLLLGTYVKSTGKKINSDSLIASGQDAMMDSIISASTVVAALIFVFTGLSLEAYLGALISVFIIRSGCEMLQEMLSKILGERIDSKMSTMIKQSICEIDGVHGAYDLILHDYGPDKFLGSVHIEVPDTFSAAQIDEITRKIQNKIYLQFNVVLAAVGIYSINTQKDERAQIREDIRHIVMSHDNVIQMHGYYINIEEKNMSFDIVIDYKEPDRRGLYQQILQELESRFPGYHFTVNMDDYISD